MLNEIEVFNVQFGDCFMLKSYDSNAAMLVDFGSMQRINPLVTQKIENELHFANEKNLMITHFHQDHCIGIQLLNNSIKFHNIYLPNFFSKSIIRLHIALLYYLNPSSQAHIVAMNLLSIVPNLCAYLNTDSIVNYVKRGDTIFNKTDAYRILWPENSNHEQIADTLYRDIIRFYEIRNDNVQNDAIRYREEHFSNLTEHYMNSFPILKDDQTMQFSEKERDKMNQVLGLIGDMRTTKDARKRLSQKLNDRISNFQNDLSICFDNIAHSNTYKSKRVRSVLFLSDVTPDNFNTISMADRLRLYPKYKVIKAPHHGTRDYFVNDLPRSKYIIISHGNRKGWPITPLYGYNYSKRKFICTNYYNSCDYCLSGKRCPAYYNFLYFSHFALRIPCARPKSICGIDISHKIRLSF